MLRILNWSRESLILKVDDFIVMNIGNFLFLTICSKIDQFHFNIKGTNGNKSIKD